MLEVLTYLAFQLKARIINTLKGREGLTYSILMFFGVWLVMFMSKFVFIWILDVLFGSYININGFFGILLVVPCVTVLHKVAVYTFKRLGQTSA